MRLVSARVARLRVTRLLWVTRLWVTRLLWVTGLLRVTRLLSGKPLTVGPVGIIHRSPDRRRMTSSPYRDFTAQVGFG
jgi:hypothetical protein